MLDGKQKEDYRVFCVCGNELEVIDLSVGTENKLHIEIERCFDCYQELA